MKPIIAIPSYCRPNNKIFHRLDDVGLDVYVFVRKEQKEQYLKSVPSYCKVVGLPTVRDLGDTRAKILEWCIKHDMEWVFMSDDDISQLEMMSWNEEKGYYDTARNVEKRGTSPSFEKEAFMYWYKVAKKHDISLSCPLYRPFARFSAGDHLRVNKGACNAITLLKVSSVLDVGNYRSVHVGGVEDYNLQYRLMSAGYKTATVGRVQYNTGAIGHGAGGCNASEGTDLKERYEYYIANFMQDLNPAVDKVFVKMTSSGIPSIKFNWKNWNGEVIQV